MMTKEELLTHFSEILSEGGVFKVVGIDETNHSPHPYTVGPAHVKHAAENYGGMMGEETLKAIKCAEPKCTLLYHEHTSDKVLFLQLLQDVLESKANDELLKIKDSLKKHGVDGVAFVSTATKEKPEELYNFIKDGHPTNEDKPQD